MNKKKRGIQVNIFQSIAKWFLPWRRLFKQKWREYIVEILLIAISVYIAFFVDRRRQNSNDFSTTKELMQLIKKDLSEDLKMYQQNDSSVKRTLREIDTLMTITSPESFQARITDVYYYARHISTINTRVRPVTHTFDDMKYSGMLQLIKNSRVSDKLSNYYHFVEKISIENNILSERLKEYAVSAGWIFDARIMLDVYKDKNALKNRALYYLTDNRATLNSFLSSAQYYYVANIGQRRQIDSASILADELYKLIESEY